MTGWNGYQTLQWPVAADGTNEPLLYTKRFNFPDGKARLYPLVQTQTTDQPNAEFDLHLNNGRLLEHFHEGNLTYRTEGIREKTPDTFVEVSPELAAERRHHQRRVGATFLALRADPRPRPRDRPRAGPRALPAHEFLRQSRQPPHQQPHRHGHPHAGVQGNFRQPARPRRNRRKSFARGNFRNGHPTPQAGVEVARKWQRPDYRMPSQRTRTQNYRDQRTLKCNATFDTCRSRLPAILPSAQDDGGVLALPFDVRCSKVQGSIFFPNSFTTSPSSPQHGACELGPTTLQPRGTALPLLGGEGRGEGGVLFLSHSPFSVRCSMSSVSPMFFSDSFANSLSFPSVRRLPPRQNKQIPAPRQLPPLRSRRGGGEREPGVR